MNALRSVARFVYRQAWALTAALIGLVGACVGRWGNKRVDVGLGPEPLINNVYHKRALALAGYSAETFVSEVYFITDAFDIRGDLLWARVAPGWLSRRLAPVRLVYLALLSFSRYRCVYLYFHGGPLGLLGLALGSEWLRNIEPHLFRLARMKVVVMPYGGDVQDLTRSPNLAFRDAIVRDYPGFRSSRARVAAQIDRWTAAADHVISGCEWVDYMSYWHTLTLAHFSIDVEAWRPTATATAAPGSRLRVLHAPNHRSTKGTEFFVRAVDDLVAEGVPIELVLAERVPNDEIRRLMATVDVVADQLIIGWYAMFALEAMAMEKPVLCYLRPDLLDLYTVAGLLQPGENPIINCTPLTVKDALRRLALDRSQLADLGRRSRAYVERHHSLEAVGAIFHRVNQTIGLLPGGGR
jgi:glycosyltransferase involved in cell wall biosynthesis